VCVSLRESETKIEQGNSDAPNPRLLIAGRVTARWLCLRHEAEVEVVSGSEKQERRRPKRVCERKTSEDHTVNSESEARSAH
jgi:hypothetical protein